MDPSTKNTQKKTTTCCICSQHITSGRVFELEKDNCAHENCLKCVTCEKIVGPEQNYFSRNTDQPWRSPICKICFEGNLKNCATCGEAITRECVEAGGESYHPDCLGCAVCLELLKVKSEFFIDSDKKAVCEKCYLSKLPNCFKCKKVIDQGKLINELNTQFHPECFVCAGCKTELVGKYQADMSNPLNIRPYCDNCYKLKFSKSCYRCRIKVDGVDFIQINDAQFLYHTNCFVCFEDGCEVKLTQEGELSVKRVMGCVEHVCKRHGDVREVSTAL